MERLTNKEELKRIELNTRINTKYVKSYFLYSQLFEYENTGLEPKEVEQLKVNQNKVAIEKLEIIKKECKSKFDFFENDYKDEKFDNDDMSNCYFGIEALVDYIIAELKGGK